MEKKEIAKINGTTHYEDGSYYLVYDDKVGVRGDVTEYIDIVSVQMNQLKAKLFNLVEGAITNETQLNAVKGLIKGFCNSHYRAVVGDLEGWVVRLGFERAKNNTITPKDEDTI